MVFDVCESCLASPYEGALLISVLWILPTVLYVIRHRVPPESRLGMALNPILWILALANLPATLYQLRVLDGEFADYEASLRLSVIANALGTLTLIALGVGHWRYRVRRKHEAAAA